MDSGGEIRGLMQPFSSTQLGDSVTGGAESSRSASEDVSSLLNLSTPKLMIYQEISAFTTTHPSPPPVTPQLLPVTPLLPHLSASTMICTSHSATESNNPTPLHSTANNSAHSPNNAASLIEVNQEMVAEQDNTEAINAIEQQIRAERVKAATFSKSGRKDEARAALSVYKQLSAQLLELKNVVALVSVDPSQAQSVQELGDFFAAAPVSLTSPTISNSISATLTNSFSATLTNSFSSTLTNSISATLTNSISATQTNSDTSITATAQIANVTRWRERLNDYKVATLRAKRSQQMSTAKELLLTMKEMERVMVKIEQGEIQSFPPLPPLPSSFYQQQTPTATTLTATTRTATSPPATVSELDISKEIAHRAITRQLQLLLTLKQHFPLLSSNATHHIQGFTNSLNFLSRYREDERVPAARYVTVQYSKLNQTESLPSDECELSCTDSDGFALADFFVVLLVDGVEVGRSEVGKKQCTPITPSI